GPEACGPWEAGDGPAGDEVAPPGHRHERAEPAHVAHVLRIGRVRLDARIELRRLVLVIAAGERVTIGFALLIVVEMPGVARVRQAVHAVNDRAGAEKQARLEAGVRD